MRAPRTVALVLLLVSCAPATGRETSAPAPAPTFHPVTLAPTLEPTPDPTRAPIAVPTPRLLVVTPGRLKGKASWYCNSDDSSHPYSVCHYRYPDKAGPDLYAAACQPLRLAMGEMMWRGRSVIVSGNGRSVVVKLIDYCASRGKTIDLYRDSADALGFDGVLDVTVRW